MALPTRVSREQQQQQQGPMINPLDLMHREFDDLISRFFGGGLFGPAAAGALPADAGMLSAFGGYGVDVREDDRHIYVEADLPGFRKEDVDISIDDHTLTISAEHREEYTEPAAQAAEAQPQQGQPQQQAQQQQEAQPPQQQQQKQPQRRAQQRAGEQQQQQQQKGQYLLRERRFQSFTRSFTLPQNVDEQNVEAKLDNGVLKITLNKLQESKPKKIQVS